MSKPRKKSRSTGDSLPSAWVRRRLLRWFARNARALPWRTTRDPYAIWVSEVMLQQTLVATVIPYYGRFLEAFPTIEALAQADEQHVLRHWQGLGYYRRAQNLVRAARVVVSNHGGRLPNEPEQLRGLPGLGRYTANAILSQALDQRLPIVEANSERVLCRLLGLSGNPKSPKVRQRLWDAAEILLPRARAGQFNQALMELGSLVCLPNEPRCPHCPLQECCVARQRGLEHKIPRRSLPPRSVDIQEVALVLRRKNAILLVQRPNGGRWGNLWEVPHIALQNGESHERAAKRLLQSIGFSAKLGKQLVTIRHGVTRYRISMVCLEATHQRGRFQSEFYVQSRWTALGRWHDLPSSSPQRRLQAAIMGGAGE
ncbi:MAG: A/G-specific adenine glycosylase [Gemmataceae bacterium]|nr:A/G-specific adenine glycosylase [Gemmataceae bacterium]